MKLLVDGKEAFPELIDLIRKATKSIYINMFIWRNDEIGRLIASEIIKAADRGVKVTVSKDRYGAVLEYCEECRSSFFHRDPAISELISCYFLELFYHLGLCSPRNIPASSDDIYKAFINNGNIEVLRDKNKYDHSKYYIFDDSTVVLGGINIEDKELKTDWRGLCYHDYMVKITEPELVNEFKGLILPSSHFPKNLKEPERLFEMRESYLNIINGAEQSLTVLMAYISTLSDYMDAFLNAATRGVDVKIVIPDSANFQDDLNKKCVMELIEKSGGKIKAYLYPDMLHAKMLMSEKTISVGSCNITKKAFKVLDELNLQVEISDPLIDHSFVEAVRESINETIKESQPISSGVGYNKFRAFCESLVM